MFFKMYDVEIILFHFHYEMSILFYYQSLVQGIDVSKLLLLSPLIWLKNYQILNEEIIQKQDLYVIEYVLPALTSKS